MLHLWSFKYVLPTPLVYWNDFSVPQKFQKSHVTSKEEEAEKMHSTPSIKESGSQPGRFLKALQEVGRVAYQAPKSH